MYHLLVGRTVADRYEVRALLGRGGMGAVYRAHDATLHRDVALKVIALAAADAEQEEALRRRFHREARMAARLRHPNVVAIHDFVRDAALGIEGIVMELLEGEDLAQRVERAGPLAPADAVEVMRQAARGIAAGHAAGLLHRDVKPPNLYLTGGARIHVHVLDFGIAQESGPSEATATHLTAHGRVPLSPRYASPEQWRGAPLTPATDVFSLAMSGWYALAGRPPYTPDELQEAGRTGRLPPLQVPPAWPAPLAALLRRALDADPARRHPDAAALEEALEAAAAGRAAPALPGPPPPRPASTPAPPPSRRPAPRPVRAKRPWARYHQGASSDPLRDWLALGLGLLLALLTGGLWWAGELSDAEGWLPVPRAAAPAAAPPPAYELTEVDTPPALDPASAERVVRTMRRTYPQHLLERRRGGTVHLRMLVQEDGRVEERSIQVVSAEEDALVRPSLRAAAELRFRPALRGEVPVRVWVDQPIVWHPDP